MTDSAQALARIAAVLGLPVEAFTRPGPGPALALAAQLAAAFLSIRQPAARAGLAATVERIAAALADDAREAA